MIIGHRQMDILDTLQSERRKLAVAELWDVIGGQYPDALRTLEARGMVRIENGLVGIRWAGRAELYRARRAGRHPGVPANAGRLDKIRLAYDLHRYGASWADVATLLDMTRDCARMTVKYHAQRRGWGWPVVPVEGGGE